MDELEKTITEQATKILSFIGVVASIDVVADVTEEDTYYINISGDDLGVVIGYHGEGLASLQSILGVILSKKVGRFIHLLVDVNGYRRDREEKIKEQVGLAIDKVKFLVKPVELSPMMAFERRLAHMEVSRHEGVESESIGEGYNRRVVIKPK